MHCSVLEFPSISLILAKQKIMHLFVELLRETLKYLFQHISQCYQLRHCFYNFTLKSNYNLNLNHPCTLGYIQPLGISRLGHAIKWKRQNVKKNCRWHVLYSENKVFFKLSILLKNAVWYADRWQVGIVTNMNVYGYKYEWYSYIFNTYKWVNKYFTCNAYT